jgi:hypothetical protein
MASTASVKTHEKVFTVEEANAALVLLIPITRDLTRTYKDLLQLRHVKLRMARSVGNLEQIETVDNDLAALTLKLNELHREIVQIGAVLKDWNEGLIDFPAMHKGRRVWLCWRLPEPRVQYWHDLHGGYVGRQPIDPNLPMTCTRCGNTGFLNTDQLPIELRVADHAAILEWIRAHEGHDVQVCDCCGDGASWYGEPGEHYHGPNGWDCGKVPDCI